MRTIIAITRGYVCTCLSEKTEGGDGSFAEVLFIPKNGRKTAIMICLGEQS